MFVISITREPHKNTRQVDRERESGGVWEGEAFWIKSFSPSSVTELMPIGPLTLRLIKDLDELFLN